MKKPKTIKPFFFKDKTHQQIIDDINEDMPVKLKYNEDLINRISARYPLITKSQISIIVEVVFRSFRELLVSGNILNFHNLFFNVKLYFYNYTKRGYKFPRLKVKATTPPKLRKNLNAK